MTIKIKRAYLDASEDDGYRILVDKLWPRGISKIKLHLDLWMKEISPSTELRKWFNHEPEKWNEFQDKYNRELKAKKDLLSKLKTLEHDEDIITLVYAAKDEKHNNAIILKDVLKKLD